MGTTAEKARIFQESLNALPKPLDILTLIDGSGSVSDAQFSTMKFCIRTLANLFEFPNPPTHVVRIGAIQFDDQAHIICNLTSEVLAFKSTVVSMPQKRGGTNAGAGFLTCLNTFNADIRNAARVIILFTDGDVSNAVQHYPQLVEGGIKVLAFGIGLSDRQKPSVVNVSENAIFVKDFNEMQQIVSQLTVLPSDPPKICIRTKSAKKASFDIVYKEPFASVELQILVAGTNQWRNLPSANTNVYYLDGLLPDTDYKVAARVQTLTKAWTNFSLPESFRTLRENTETLVLRSVNLPSINNTLIDGINSYSVPPQWLQLNIPYVNIVLLGNIGNGKSAYFNSIYSTLLGQYAEVQMHKVSTQTVTLTISKKFLTNKSIRLWDTYGWTSANNSYEKEFEFLLEGALADGYKEHDEVLGKLNLSPQVGDKVHAIILVYEMPAVMTESNMNSLKRFYQKMCAKNLQPIVVLTKVDLIEEADLANRLSDIHDSGVIEVYISEFCKASTIPRANVFPVVNFRGAWQERDYVAEKLILNAFHTALKFAQSKVSTLLEQKVVVYDRSDPEHPKKLAIVDRGSVDDSVALLAERISREPGLEQFQLYSRASAAIVPRAQLTQTRFMDCASASAPGYWEVFGIQHGSTPPSPVKGSPSKQATATPKEIAIFGDGKKSIGSVIVSRTASLADLRSLIREEVEIPDSLLQFQFMNLGGPTAGGKSPLVDETYESNTKISDVMDPNDVDLIRITKLQPLEIGIKLEPNKKVGFIEGVPLDSTLEIVKRHIAEQTEIDFNFRFLTLSGNSVSPVQEAKRTLQSIVREGENGGLFFVIRGV
eukprot:Phypoly_transcript_02861.p1 GENE.Phypoly_transcript_02861~~Phypoly_transcript_02861.p1  ORF type:complete len:826 (+),score=123.82 Phypoly_transcript_02861:122-2599(+)